MRVLPEGYHARPATLDDAARVAALIASHQLANLGSVEISEAEVRNDWAGADLAADTIVIELAGQIRASADLVVRPGLVSVYGYVHPDDSGRGLGSFLVTWGEQRASTQTVPTVVRHHIVSTNLRAVRLLAGRGYVFQRAVLWLERDLTAEQGDELAASTGSAARSLPTGLRLRTYRGDADEPAVHQAFEAGSLDMNGRAPNTLEQWLATARTKDKELFFIVEAGDEVPAEAGVGAGCAAVVGILIASLGEVHVAARSDGAGTDAAPLAAAPTGRVDSLRVVREWRRRGIGASLLTTAFGALRERGAGRVSLSVDAASPTGAPNLYLDAGMDVTRRYLVMERTFGGG